jgi:hypothetical protein
MHSHGRLLFFGRRFMAMGATILEGFDFLLGLDWRRSRTDMRCREMSVDENEYLPKEDGNGGQNIYITNRLLSL